MVKEFVKANYTEILIWGFIIMSLVGIIMAWVDLILELKKDKKEKRNGRR